ncbi:MAG: GNAT family N-acetyltransferase, partial [Anaerovibrio sp.]|uniref:GNAT family N-acetyltransferase n=1 Tax=Anaerovibrio sp. TaxID=1872532 RepID=UPI0025F30980
KWFKRIKDDENSFYWIIEYDGMPIGLINLVNWDRRNNLIHTGLYIAVNEKRSMTLLMDLMSNLNDYVFYKLGVNKVTKEIMDINKNLILINDRFGFKEEGVMRQVVLKHGEYHDLHIFGMLRSEWDQLRSGMEYEKIDFE